MQECLHITTRAFAEMRVAAVALNHRVNHWIVEHGTWTRQILLFQNVADCFRWQQALGPNDIHNTSTRDQGLFGHGRGLLVSKVGRKHCHDSYTVLYQILAMLLIGRNALDAAISQHVTRVG